MPEQSISVEFKSTCEPILDDAVLCEISIEHDDLLNGGSSTFQVGGQIFYRVYPAGVYKFYLSLGGAVSIITPNKIEEKTEELIFDGSNQANLTHPLGGAFSYRWLGSALEAESPHIKCTPTVTAEFGSTILAAKKSVFGTLEAIYEYTHASVKFIPANSGKQILLVCRTCEEKEVCASIMEEIEDQAFDTVTLTINDACEPDLKVVGAQAEVNGELIEAISGEDGKIHIGLLAKGTHSIKITAPGYVSSDEDALSNDEIIVK